MTFLEAINEVMTRLREPQAGGVATNKYVSLIAALVNDSKRAVEDAANWSVLLDTITVTTVAGTADYSLTGANERASVQSVTRPEVKAILKRAKARDLIKLNQIDTGQNQPTMWSIIGMDSSDNLQIRLHPIPDAVYTLKANCVLPENELSLSGDTITVPWEPVVMRAYAMALKERGEDQGNSYQEAMDNYRRILSRYLILNSHGSAGGGETWQVR